MRIMGKYYGESKKKIEYEINIVWAPSRLVCKICSFQQLFGINTSPSPQTKIKT